MRRITILCSSTNNSNTCSRYEYSGKYKRGSATIPTVACTVFSISAVFGLFLLLVSLSVACRQMDLCVMMLQARLERR
jgi:hypothetical protein